MTPRREKSNLNNGSLPPSAIFALRRCHWLDGNRPTADIQRRTLSAPNHWRVLYLMMDGGG